MTSGAFGLFGRENYRLPLRLILERLTAHHWFAMIMSSFWLIVSSKDRTPSTASSLMALLTASDTRAFTLSSSTPSSLMALLTESDTMPLMLPSIFSS